MCVGAQGLGLIMYLFHNHLFVESLLRAQRFSQTLKERVLTVLRPSSVTPVLRDPPSPSSCKHSKHTREEMGQENKGWGWLWKIYEERERKDYYKQVDEQAENWVSIRPTESPT